MTKPAKLLAQFSLQTGKGNIGVDSGRLVYSDEFRQFRGSYPSL